MIRKCAYVFLALCVMAGFARGQAREPFGPGVDVMQDRADRLVAVLPNRMIVIAQELRAAPVASVQVWVKTGSVYEQEHVGAGLSHFLEHLLSGGTTTNRSEAESNAVLGRIGARTNASTSLDTVRYYIDTTSSHVDTAIDLMTDWMRNSLITDEEFTRERDVIQREFDMGEGEPGRVLWKLTQQARYREHPARHPTIGYIDEFLKISRDEIHAFYRRMYVPNNMVFVVAGNIDRRAVVKRIADHWRDAQPGKLPEITFPLEQERSDEKPSVTGVASVERPRLRLAWPGTRLGADGDYALDLLAVILGQGESSRLVRSVRDGSRLVNNVSAYNVSQHWGEGFFGIDADIAVERSAQSTTKPQSAESAALEQGEIEARAARALERARIAVIEEVGKVRREGVSNDELARAKRVTVARVVYDAQTADAVASRLATDVIGMADPDYSTKYAEAINKITAEEVASAAERFLKDSRMIAVTLLPLGPGEKMVPLRRSAEAPAPNGEHRKERANLDNLSIVDRMHEAIGPAGEKSAATRIDTMQKRSLSNGLRVMLQRSTVSPSVSIQMYQLGGLLSDEPGREGVANAVASMLSRGTARSSAERIARRIEDLGADLDAQCGSNTSFTRAICLKGDWKTVLQLVAEVNLSPTFPDDEWAKLKPRLLAAIARQNESWSGELRTTFRDAYFGGHTWSQTPLGRAKVVESLTTQDLRAFHQKRLGASETVLAVVGDIDPDEVMREVELLFSEMPAKPAEGVKLTAPAKPESRVVVRRTAKPVAAVQIGLGPTGKRADPDFPAIQVLGRVLSSFPSGWLDEELRGKGPGLVYAVGAGQFTGLAPGFFSMSFNTKPASLKEAISRSMAVARRAKDEEVDADTLARAKTGVIVDEYFGKQSNSDRAADAALNELYGLGLDESAKFQAAVNAMTSMQLRDIARKVLVNPVVAVISPEVESEDALREAAGIAGPAPTQPDTKGKASDTRPANTKTPTATESRPNTRTRKER